MSGKKKIRPPESVQLKLQPRLTIAEAPALHKQLLEQLGGGRPLTVDAAAVEEVDTAALQVLLAAKRAFESRRLEFRWHASSAALQRAAALIGVANALALDADA